MIKYFCDRCGKEEKEYTMFRVNIIAPELRRLADHAWDDPYILCRECVAKLDEFISELGRCEINDN